MVTGSILESRGGAQTPYLRSEESVSQGETIWRDRLEDTTERGGQGWRQNEPSSQLRPQALEPDMGWCDCLWEPLWKSWILPQERPLLAESVILLYIWAQQETRLANGNT